MRENYQQTLKANRRADSCQEQAVVRWLAVVQESGEEKSLHSLELDFLFLPFILLANAFYSSQYFCTFTTSLKFHFYPFTASNIFSTHQKP